VKVLSKNAEDGDTYGEELDLNQLQREKERIELRELHSLDARLQQQEGKIASLQKDIVGGRDVY
jgi:hypothetical protein